MWALASFTHTRCVPIGVGWHGFGAPAGTGCGQHWLLPDGVPSAVLQTSPVGAAFEAAPDHAELEPPAARARSLGEPADQWRREVRGRFGVSVEKVEEGLIALEHDGLSSIQVIFNPFRLKPLDEVLPAASAAGVPAFIAKFQPIRMHLIWLSV